MKRKFFISTMILTGLLGSAHGALLAFTDFNASTASGGTKSNLAWTLTGLQDPGDMSATEFGGGAVNMFDGTALTQDIFIPGINTGNGNTSWETNVSIAVAAGFNVTLTDITFNSVSVNGGQAENVNRRNDYSMDLLNPSAVSVATISVSDVVAGTSGGGQPLVTLDFTDVVLSDPGTYTLRIRGGDFLDIDETGNHTGIDNLSINGDASPVPEASTVLLSVLAFVGLISTRRRK